MKIIRPLCVLVAAATLGCALLVWLTTPRPVRVTGEAHMGVRTRMVMTEWPLTAEQTANCGIMLLSLPPLCER